MKIKFDYIFTTLSAEIGLFYATLNVLSAKFLKQEQKKLGIKLENKNLLDSQVNDLFKQIITNNNTSQSEGVIYMPFDLLHNDKGIEENKDISIFYLFFLPAFQRLDLNVSFSDSTSLKFMFEKSI